MATIPWAEHNRVRLAPQADWATPFTSWTTAHDLLVESAPPPRIGNGVRAGGVMRLDGGSAPISAGGPEPVEYALAGPVQGVSVASPEASPAAVPDFLLAASAMGGAGLAAYRTDLAEASGGSTTTKIGVTNSASPAILVGDALLIPLASGHSWGWVTAVNAATTPHEITVTTLAGAPATTGTVFGARVAYLTTAPSPSALGLQWLGPDAAAAARLVGLSASRYMIDLSPGQEIRYEADTLSLYGIPDNTGGPPLPETPIFPQIPDAIGANGGRLLLGGSVYCVQRAVLTVEAQQVASRCHSATSGRSAHLRAGPTMTLEVDILVDDDHTDQPDPGHKPGLLQLDVSTTPGRAMSLIMRVPVLQEMGEPVDLDGIHGRRLVYQSGPVVSTGTSYARAPGSLAWG